MERRPPIFTLTYTLFPSTTLFRAIGLTVVVRIDLGLRLRRCHLAGGQFSRSDMAISCLVGRLTEDLSWFVRVVSRHLRLAGHRDRKSTRLNSSSLMRISYAVFCLKKKKNNKNISINTTISTE